MDAVSLGFRETMFTTLRGLSSSALNKTYKYGLGVHYAQARGGRPGMTACVARLNARNSIDRSHRPPLSVILVPSLRIVMVPQR